MPLMLGWLLAGCDPTQPDTAPEEEPPEACAPLRLQLADERVGDELPGGGGDVGAAVGVALGDLDGDGWLDGLVAGPRGTLALRNDGSGGWADEAGFTLDGGPLPIASALALGDLDGDGDLDVVFGGLGVEVRLGWNDGAGQLTGEAIEGSAGDTFGVVLADVDGDADLDLFVAAGDADADYAETAAGGVTGDLDRLFLQDDDHRFQAAVGALPDDTRAGLTRQAALVDVEGDGDLDLYLARDAGPDVDPNRLLINDGRAHFLEATRCACDRAMYAGGVAVGDLDGDADPDLYLTGVGPPVLLDNLGDGTFLDATDTHGDAAVPAAADARVSWGTGALDLDGDRDEDLLVLFGHSGRDLAAAGVSGEDGLEQPSRILLADGEGGFVRALDTGLDERGPARAYASGDLDHDGRADLVVIGTDFVRTWRAQGGCPPGVTLRLSGPSPVGAKVEAEVDGLRRTRWFLPGTAGSTSAPELQLGAGGRARIDRILVTWPGGGETLREDVEAGTVLELQQP